jgi:hypothetical protein
MRRWILAALLVVSLAAPGRAVAQPTSDPVLLYREAFVSLAAGDRVRARSLLSQLVTEHPGDPLAARSQLLLAKLDAPPPPVAVVEKRPSKLARGEFLFFQTMHGIAIGGEVCAIVECDGARPIAAALTLGAGAGFGLAYLFSMNGIESAHALLLDTATVWGFWNAAALTLTLDRDWDGPELAGIFLAGQGLGLLAGELAWRLAKPSAGEVSLASSVGFWTGVVTLWVNGLLADDFDTDVIWGTIWAASDVGFVGGALLGRKLQVSRGRALLIDVGGLVGALAGMGIGALTDDADGFFGLSLAGTIGGLVVATWATRNWDSKKAPPISPVLTPTQGGALLGIGGRF